MIQNISEDVVDEGLKHYGSVSEPKRYPQILVVTGGAAERCLPLVTFTDVHHMVGVAKVQFSENSHPLKEFEC